MDRETLKVVRDLINYAESLAVSPTGYDVGRLHGKATIARIYLDFGNSTSCDATVVRHCEDPGMLCGKKCEPGSHLCSEHKVAEN
jgi:hypothetical protein